MRASKTVFASTVAVFAVAWMGIPKSVPTRDDLAPGFDLEEARHMVALARAAQNAGGSRNLPREWGTEVCSIRGGSLFNGFIARNHPPTETSSHAHYGLAIAVNDDSGDAADFLRDYQNRLVRSTLLERDSNGVQVLESFNSIAVRAGLTNVIDCMKSQSGRHLPFRLFVTGHGAAGGIATILATAIKQEYASVRTIKLYTFGSPKPGNGELAFLSAMEIPGDYKFRVVLNGDFMPGLPGGASYAHVGSRRAFDPVEPNRDAHSVEAYVAALRR